MPTKKMPPHLIEVNRRKRCSECGKVFSPDSKPSLSKAFAQHVRSEHSPKSK